MNEQLDREGVIQFALAHTSERLANAAVERLPELLGWRWVLHQLAVIGEDTGRYHGLGFGNVSVRLPPYPGERGERHFVVSASQTGGVADPTTGDWAVVTGYDLARNRLSSRGPMPPSSESLTHAALYDLSPHIRCVLHGHSPEIWQCADDLRLPTTPADVPYGTVAMARAVVRLYHDTNLAERRVLTMAGHRDGVLSFGRDPDEAGSALVATLAASHVCRNSRKATERTT